MAGENKSVPFRLTNGQEVVVWGLRLDKRSPQRTRRKGKCRKTFDGENLVSVAILAPSLDFISRILFLVSGFPPRPPRP